MLAKPIDRTLLITVLLLVSFGFIIFTSASLGLLARDGAQFGAVALKQFMFGIVLGGAALFGISRLDYHLFKKYSFYFFLFSALLTLLVFLPGIGYEHGGAKRWLLIFGFSFQPGELLKMAFVIYLAAWFSVAKEKIGEVQRGLLPLSALLAVTGGILLMQPDTDGFLILCLAGISMFIAAGGRFRDLGILGFFGVIGGGILIIMRPYLKDRLMTFLDLGNADYLGSGYQIYQSLIAIGSGGIFGRGFGQSIQKFNFLPEPIGDSIFAVAAEEFGFIGAAFLIALFVMLALRGLRVAARAPDAFGRLVAVGIVILITSQSFLNIASMLALFPLSGTPLVFVSQGGTALLVALIEIAVLFNISRYQKA